MFCCCWRNFPYSLHFLVSHTYFIYLFSFFLVGMLLPPLPNPPPLPAIVAYFVRNIQIYIPNHNPAQPQDVWAALSTRPTYFWYLTRHTPQEFLALVQILQNDVRLPRYRTGQHNLGQRANACKLNVINRILMVLMFSHRKAVWPSRCICAVV